MKELLITILASFTILIAAQTPENLEYIQTLENANNYAAALLTNNNRLYVHAQGGIEEYEILTNGSLELISNINTINPNGSNAVIIDDCIYAEVADFSNTTKIYQIDISINPMAVEHIYDTNTTNVIFKMSVNEDYLFYVLNGEINAVILNRSTLEPCGSILTGGFFEIIDNLLLYQVNEETSNYLYIDDISDINNQIPISNVYLGENQQNITYLFEYPYLFIGQNEQVVILDLSDIENPTVLATITDIPNLSYPNFFISLSKYEGYLILKNCHNNFWIYNVSDLSNPSFQNFINEFAYSQNANRGLILHENFLYLAQSGQNIFQFSVSSLPQINFVNEYGNIGQFIYYGYSYPFLVYSNYYTKAIQVTNITIPMSFEILNNAYCSVKSYYFHDGVLGFIIEDSNAQKYLNLYSYDSYNIVFESSIILTSNEFEDVARIGEFLALVAEDDGEIQVCEINQDYTLDYVHLISTGENCRIVEQTNQCSQNQVFVTSEINDDNVVTIFSAQAPFNEIGSFSLSQFGSYIDRIHQLSDNRMLLSGWVYSESYYKLVEYISPEEINVLDTFSTYNGSLMLHDNLLINRRNLSGEIDFVSWENDQFEIQGSYEFPVETHNCFFDYDNNKTYTIGRYNVQEYSCDFVSVDDHQIPVVKANLTNYPNPFNPSTNISYNITADSKVDLKVYNMKGQLVKTLVSSNQTAGVHTVTWNGTDNTGRQVGSGLYFYKMNAGKYSSTKKMIMLK
jgi:FlgD Ig-like domain